MVRFSIFDSDTCSGQTPLIFASVFVLIGLVLGGYGFTQYQGQAQSIDNAVNITAAVTDTNVRTDSSRRGGIDYQAEISFDYSYDGESYSSDFIYPLDDDREFSQESEAEEFLEGYPVGQQVDAYVSPGSPGKAFLMKKRSDQPLLFMLIGGLMAAAGSYKILQRFI
jgi:hypothetical protein